MIDYQFELFNYYQNSYTQLQYEKNLEVIQGHHRGNNAGIIMMVEAENLIKISIPSLIVECNLKKIYR